MHCRDRKIFLSHIICEPVDLAPGVAVYDVLCDRQVLVEIAERVKFTFLALDGNKELFDSLQRELIALD